MIHRVDLRSLGLVRQAVYLLVSAHLAAQFAAAQAIDYVIQISVDGLHSGQLQNLLLTQPDRYTNFQRFVSEGATTFNARTDFSSNVTLPNHTSMLTGRPVRQPGDDPTLHHGYLNNVVPGLSDTLHNRGNPAVPYIASTFDVAHDRGLSTALYTGKEKFVIYEQSYNVTETTNGGRPDPFLEDGDHGVNKIDKYQFEVVRGTSSGIMQTLLEDFQTDPFRYTFLHFLEPDSAGHAYGWRSEQWNNAVHSIDQYLGQLFGLIETNPQLTGRTAMVLTADHGGSLLTHGATTEINLFRIPFLVWGPGVVSGADLYDLNTLTRRDPGQLQLDYNAPWQPIRNGDSGNLALTLLGLPAVDGSSINSRQDLRVDAPKIATWWGAIDQSGLPGDGRTWSDSRNWQRDASQDRRPMAGDFVLLPASARPTLVELDGTQQLQSLRVDGDYQLFNGDVQLVGGEVTVAENQRLVVSGSLSSPLGIIKQGLGTLTADLITASDLLISAGRVEGPMAVDGDVANRSTMAPGSVTAVQRIHGHLTQSATGILQFMLGPDGTNGQVIVDGTMIYRGTLDVTTAGEQLDPDQPGEFARWTLMTTGRRIGTFVSVDYNGERLVFDRTTTDIALRHEGNGLFRRLEYSDTSLQWTNYRAIVGDANGDGAFNSTDLVAVFTAGGFENGIPLDADWTTGDWNGDLDFTTNDLVAALASGQFEQSPILFVAATVVPEPSAATHGFILCAFLCRMMVAAARQRQASAESHDFDARSR